MNFMNFLEVPPKRARPGRAITSVLAWPKTGPAGWTTRASPSTRRCASTIVRAPMTLPVRARRPGSSSHLTLRAPARRQALSLRAHAPVAVVRRLRPGGRRLLKARIFVHPRQRRLHPVSAPRAAAAVHCPAGPRAAASAARRGLRAPCRVCGVWWQLPELHEPGRLEGR